MKLSEGMIVRSLAGHDAGGCFLVLSVREGHANIADGRRRKVERPKRKSSKHLLPVGFLPEEERLPVTNRKLRRILLRFAAEAESAQMDREG